MYTVCPCRARGVEPRADNTFCACRKFWNAPWRAASSRLRVWVIPRSRLMDLARRLMPSIEDGRTVLFDMMTLPARNRTSPVCRALKALEKSGREQESLPGSAVNSFAKDGWPAPARSHPVTLAPPAPCRQIGSKILR